MLRTNYQSTDATTFLRRQTHHTKSQMSQTGEDVPMLERSAAKTSGSKKNNENMLELHVESILGDTSKISSINPNTTVKELKNKISKQQNIAPERQRLIYLGKVLINENTLKSYKITNNQTLHLTFQIDNDNDNNKHASKNVTFLHLFSVLNCLCVLM